VGVVFFWGGGGGVLHMRAYGIVLFPCSAEDICSWHVKHFTAHMRFHSRRLSFSSDVTEKVKSFRCMCLKSEYYQLFDISILIPMERQYDKVDS
jgi:hypothetical protein